MMLGMCASSFGYILIYNVSTSVGGADDDTGAKVKIPLKGYLVLTLDDPTTVIDANLILYGKDTDKQKVYVQIDYTDMDDGHYVDIWHIGDYLFLEVAEYPGGGPFYFDVLVMGKWKVKSIGPLEDTTAVASSMKGAFIIWDGFILGSSADQDVSGTANISLTLNNSGTKWANGNNDEDEQKTQDQVVDEIIGTDGILTDKGYTAAELP
jgi:hypothetical protein